MHNKTRPQGTKIKGVKGGRQTDRARLRRTRHTRQEARRGWVENARALADRAASIAREKPLGQTIVVDLWTVTLSNLIRKVGFSCGHLTS